MSLLLMRMGMMCLNVCRYLLLKLLVHALRLFLCPKQLLAVEVLAEFKASKRWLGLRQANFRAKNGRGSSESNISSKSDALLAERRSPHHGARAGATFFFADVHTSNEILILL